MTERNLTQAMRLASRLSRSRVNSRQIAAATSTSNPPSPAREPQASG